MRRCFRLHLFIKISIRRIFSRCRKIYRIYAKVFIYTQTFTKDERTSIMPNLNIVGNGFDLYHGLPTSYYYFACYILSTNEKLYDELAEIIYVFLTIFLYLLKCPQSLILSALRAFCFCGKPHISRSIFLYFRYQAWLKSW